MATSLPQPLLRALDPRELELIIMPTEQCNFRCTYCYEDFSIGRMKRATIDGLRRLMQSRAPELDRLDLSWFGGEPLAAKDVVLELSELASHLARQHSKLRYRGSITTNAYLLGGELFRELVRLGNRSFQITLDGWAEQHDATRRRADGAGTFARIWRNLLALRGVPGAFSVNLRIHLQPHNRDGVETLLDRLIDEFGGDPRFDAFFKPVGDWGGPRAGQIETLGAADARSVQENLERRWHQVRPRPSPVPTREPRPFVCYASKPNSLMIRADGHVGKCTVMLNDRRNAIGTLHSDGTIALHPGRLGPWLRGFKSLDPAELGCPAHGLPALVRGDRLLPLV